MSPKRWGSVIVLAILIGPHVAEAGSLRWTIDPARTEVRFAVRHLLVSTVRGRMGPAAGTLELDASDPTRSVIAATVDARGIDTGEPRRDDHLRSADFLDTGRFPTIAFRSTAITRRAADRFSVVGDLTLRGVTRPVALEVTGAPVPVTDPAGRPRLAGRATARINRALFGVSGNAALDVGGVTIGNEVDVTIDVELVPADAGAP